jgi:hypothetical protein
MKKNAYRVFLIILIIIIGLISSCSPKITLTTLDGKKSKTIKYKGEVTIKDGRLFFVTKKGTKQAPPIDMYQYDINK